VLAKLKSKYKYLLVASEATGDYHRLLAQCCIELDIDFKLLNPLTVKGYLRHTVRKIKTDTTDAEAIARVALRSREPLLSLTSLNTTKPMLRTAVSLSQMSQMLALMRQHWEHLDPNERELIQELTNCEKRLKAAVSVYRSHAVAATDPTIRKLLMTIPGIGETIATTLIAELGDISRFKDSKAVIAYAGLDPKVLQSGSTLNRYGHLTKRGAAHLRRSLFIAASIARQHDPNCKSLYDKKRSEGKRYTVATVVVARKLVRIVFTVWATGMPYEVKDLT
jgi:transposase